MKYYFANTWLYNRDGHFAIDNSKSDEIRSKNVTVKRIPVHFGNMRFKENASSRACYF